MHTRNSAKRCTCLLLVQVTFVLGCFMLGKVLCGCLMLINIFLKTFEKISYG